MHGNSFRPSCQEKLVKPPVDPIRPPAVDWRAAASLPDNFNWLQSAMRFVVSWVSALTCIALVAQVGARPVPEPRDHPFQGTIQLRVEATDVIHSLFRVTEMLPVQSSGELVLLYPQWETTSHGPTASAVELAGLRMQIDGHDIEWRRDTIDVHAFHLTVPAGARTLALHFEYLSPRSSAKLRPDMVVVEWQRLLLYPAGWFARNIPVIAQLELPPGLHAFTSLTSHTQDSTANLLSFAPETLDRLADAPVYAARYTRQLELAPSPGVPVHLDLLADAPAGLEVSPTDLAQLQALVVQASKVFGPPPFRHYDALVSLSDPLSPGGGLEHLDEGENNLPANYFTAGEQQLGNRDLIAHEYVHAWNGRFRQPAGLWSPNFNLPTDPSMLWVYEGQTEFWGRVLAARAGLRTTQQTLDKLALDAALVANRSGRAWKTLADSTLDVLYMPGHAVAWRDWQRREDYYSEGVLLWLDIDARLRELSHNTVGIDQFARRFFATHGKLETISTYTFEDICETLNTLSPAPWRSILDQHLFTHASSDSIAGLARAGWQLTYNSTPTETFLQDQAEAGVINLDDSIGAQFRPNGDVRSVTWNGPAFRAGLSPDIQVVAVNGQPFSSAAILSAVTDSASVPLRLTLHDRDTHRDITVHYAGPLRYPHLERLSNTPDRLTPLLAPH
jgi:predicted metalloprotease with PDZ domain